MANNNVVIMMLATSIILLATGMVLYPTLIVVIKNMESTVKSNTVYEVTTATTETTATMPPTTVKVCANSYVNWQGVCYYKYEINPSFVASLALKNVPITKDSCGSGAYLAVADTDEDNVRVQSYIDSLGPGQYYINGFQVSTKYQKYTDQYYDLVKNFWVFGDLQDKANIVMRFKQNGLWFSVDSNQKIATYVLCQLPATP